MLEKLFKDKDHVRTIEHFILHEKWEQNEKDLCEILKIYRRSLLPILESLVQIGLISLTREIALTKFYKTNPESPLLRPLRILNQIFR